jgi:hypothetical protein
LAGFGEAVLERISISEPVMNERFGGPCKGNEMTAFLDSQCRRGKGGEAQYSMGTGG